MNYILRFGLWPAAFAFCICAETLPPETERQLAREIYKELVEIKSVALDKQKVNEFTLNLQMKRQTEAAPGTPGKPASGAPVAKGPNK